MDRPTMTRAIRSGCEFHGAALLAGGAFGLAAAPLAEPRVRTVTGGARGTRKGAWAARRSGTARPEDSTHGC
jgi:hypothetical protein